MNGRIARHRLLMGLLALGTCFVAVPSPALSGESQPVLSGQGQNGSGESIAPPPAETPAAVPGSAPGMMIHVDPKTGAILKGPAPGSVPFQMSPELQNALSTSHQGLAEVPSPAPGGGVKVDLQGRFRSPLVGTVDADGNVKIQHLHEMPQSDEKK
jgi:hypothetical protein